MNYFHNDPDLKKNFSWGERGGGGGGKLEELNFF